MRPQRQVVDYSLRRRALLRDLQAGRVGTYEVCDASPYLLSAARFHGEGTEERCPVCRRENLTHVHYIYGDELKQSAGQARSRAEIAMLARTARQIQVYVVEVCRGCSWNHLVEQYLLGEVGRPVAPGVVTVPAGAAPPVSLASPAASAPPVSLASPPASAPQVSLEVTRDTSNSYLPVDGPVPTRGDSPRSKGVTG
jgi:hypothetical protein